MKSLPSLPTHLKIYEVLSLNTDVCREVDNLVDVEPPLINEVFPEERGGERLWRNFGYRKNEFPFMYKYIYRKLGLEGVRCLVTHFILDHIENVTCRGFDIEMIKDEVEALIHSYIEECSIMAQCDNIFKESAIILNKILELTSGNLESMIKIISSEANLKHLPIDIIMNASSEIVSIMLRGVLITKGHKGKSGFSIDHDFYSKHYSQLRTKVKYLIRQKLYDALATQTIKDIQGLIKSLNNIKKKTVKSRTIGEVLQVIKGEASSNSEFHKLLEIIRECIEKAINSYLE